MTGNKGSKVAAWCIRLSKLVSLFAASSIDWLARKPKPASIYLMIIAKKPRKKTLSLFAQLRQMAASNNISLCRFQHLWWRGKLKVRVTPPWDTYTRKKLNPFCNGLINIQPVNNNSIRSSRPQKSMQTWLIAHAFNNNNSQLVYTAEIRARERMWYSPPV